MPGPAATLAAHPTEQGQPAVSGIADPALWLRGAHYTLVLYSDIDGGGHTNVGRGPASGRYQLWTRSGSGACAAVTHVGDRAADEAEYLTLIAALDDLLARVAANQRDPAAYSLTVYTRRELVVKQLNGTYRVRSATLQPLQQQARSRLDRFAGVELILEAGCCH